MDDIASPAVAEQRTRKPRKSLWWAIGGGFLVLALAAAAGIAVPRILHAQRVAAYSELVALSNGEIREANRLRALNDQATILYALQAEEAKLLVPMLADLASLSDHYFTDADRGDIASASAALESVLSKHALDPDEQTMVEVAQHLLESEGFMWQTDFLNLTPEATEVLIVQSPKELIVPVSDDDVTASLVEEAEARLLVESAARGEVERTHVVVTDRSAELIDAVAATLVPLKEAAESAPAQVLVVLDMYPGARNDVVEHMRVSAQRASDSTAAELFMYDDVAPVPVVGETPEDIATFSTTDAWRAAIIAQHLTDYSDAITAAWITDAGGVEEAIGRNPYAPWFF